MKRIFTVLALVFSFHSVHANQLWDQVRDIFENETVTEPKILLKIPAMTYENCGLISRDLDVPADVVIRNKAFGKTKAVEVWTNHEKTIAGQLIADNSKDSNGEFDGLLGEMQTKGETYSTILRGVYSEKNVFQGFIVQISTPGIFGRPKFYVTCEIN